MYFNFCLKLFYYYEFKSEKKVKKNLNIIVNMKFTNVLVPNTIAVFDKEFKLLRRPWLMLFLSFAHRFVNAFIDKVQNVCVINSIITDLSNKLTPIYDCEIENKVTTENSLVKLVRMLSLWVYFVNAIHGLSQRACFLTDFFFKLFYYKKTVSIDWI